MIAVDEVACAMWKLWLIGPAARYGLDAATEALMTQNALPIAACVMVTNPALETVQPTLPTDRSRR